MEESNQLDETTVTDCLSSGGALEQHLGDKFNVRREQILLAKAVARSLNRQQSTSIFEAGTGTGKTFAYLVPLILADAKAVISTATKALQEQLVEHDIPTVLQALGKDVEVQLLKGKRNYICTTRLAEALAAIDSGTTNPSLDTDEITYQEDLHKIAEYASNSYDGDRAGIKDVATNSSAWADVVPPQQNIGSSQCCKNPQCFVNAAKKRAREAQILVVNHALLLSDAAYTKTAGDDDYSLFSDFSTAVIDEAHTLPEGLSNYFSESLSTGQLRQDLAKTRKSIEKLLPNNKQVPDSLGKLTKVLDEFNDSCKGLDKATNPDEFFKFNDGRVQQNFDKFGSIVATVKEALLPYIDTSSESEDPGTKKVNQLYGLLNGVEHFIQAWLKPVENYVAWVMPFQSSVQLTFAPVITTESFTKLAQDKNMLLLSATMSVAGKLDNFKQRLGINTKQELVVNSPFDYPNNSLLLLQPNFPEPKPKHYKEFCNQVTALAEQLIIANQGRAFVLFTSKQNLTTVARQLRHRFAKEFTVLVQDDKPPQQLLNEFRTATKPVLLGTRTFWQGVDVSGDTLSLVIIDKIPFTHVEDPILKAQINQLKEQDRNPFNELQVPHAALVLKQAAGRLIRSETDRGVLVICDPRMSTKGYGRVLIDTLPPMRRSNNVADAIDFLRKV